MPVFGQERLLLSDSDERWAKKLDALVRAPHDRAAGVSIVRDAGYDIVTEAARLTDLYLAMAKR